METQAKSSQCLKLIVRYRTILELEGRSMQAAHAGTRLQLRLSRGRSVILNRFSPPKIREKETRQTSLLRKLELIKKMVVRRGRLDQTRTVFL